MTDSGTASPQEFGKYLLLERIAMGGMAEIFRAKKLGAEGFEKELVIKRVLPHYTDDDSFITMFKDEARIASNLNHANICQVFEFDELEGSFYIAMEYIPGRDLKRVNEEGRDRDFPLNIGQVAWIGSQVAAGLHYAHRKEYNGAPLNIVHRDVTPHNIMVSLGGDVKLMDFGIAKAAARSTRTQAGTVKGKCAYMSPEQARGKDIDGRSDVFALGIVMWETLAHQRLFLGDSEFETLSNVLKKQITPLSEVNPQVPPRLEGIISKALARTREERYDDAAAMERDLLAFFYSECDPNKTQLDGYMKYLFDGGLKPDAEDEPPPPVPDAMDNADTMAMESINPNAHEGMANSASADMAARAVAGVANMSAKLAKPQFGEGDEATTVTGETSSTPPPPDPLGGPPPPRPPGLQDPGPPTTPMPGLAPPTERSRAISDADLARSVSESQRMSPVEASGPALTAYTGQTSGAGGGKGKIVGAAVLVFALLGGGVALLSGGDEGAAKPAAGGGDSADPGTADEGGAGSKTATAAGVMEHRNVRIDSTPGGATVYLDGDVDLFYKTPFEQQRRVGSKIKVKAKLAGHKTNRQTITVEAGEGAQDVNVTLAPK